MSPQDAEATEVGGKNRFKTAARGAWARGGKFVREKGLVILIIGVILGAVAGVFAEEIYDARKSRPFVAVILSNEDPNFTIPMELMRGMQDAMKSGPSIPTPNQQSVAIQFVMSSLTKEDTARAVRTECLDKPDCIAIVGASDSTTTAAALEEILRSSANSRPTLIMPIATATSVTETAARGQFAQILRLVPNNDDQAQQIKSFIASRAPVQRVAVIVDPANPEYSQNLAAIIVQAIRKNGGDATRIDYQDSQTLAEASLNDRDFLVFVGTSSHGLEIIHDMIRLGIQVPIVFTDGNTVREVINKSMKMPGKAYFLTPVAELNNLREPGYTAIGRDTYAILSNIFTQSNELTRETVATFVSKRKYNISLEPGAAGDYKFGADGENSLMHFKIFSIEKGQVKLEDRF